jgi:hypothetical protein
MSLLPSDGTAVAAFTAASSLDNDCMPTTMNV